MDLISGCPFWPINSGLLATYPKLHAALDCDVLVIGGGITGAFTAHALQRAGLATVVLDRRDIGFGSTAASTCLLQYEIDLSLAQLTKIHGERNAVRCYEASRGALLAIAQLSRSIRQDCSFSHRESLYAASRPRDVPGLKREAALRQTHGFSVDYWDRRKIAANSSLPYHAALLSHEAGEVDAYRLTHALFREAAARGTQIYDRTEVVRHRFTRTGVELRTREGHRVRARRLVVATGYEVRPFLREPVMALHSTFALVTEPLPDFPGWPERRLIWETARPYLYLRTTADHRAIIGGGDVPFRDPVARDQLLTGKTRWLIRRLRQLFPRLRPELAYAWTGTFAVTEDGLPYIGQIKSAPHTWFALGYGGNGILYSQIAAEIICAGCLGESHAQADLFAFDRAVAR